MRTSPVSERRGEIDAEPQIEDATRLPSMDDAPANPYPRRQLESGTLELILRRRGVGRGCGREEDHDRGGRCIGAGTRR